MKIKSGFRGLQVADQKFTRTSKTCSECIPEDTCELRDCKLEVHTVDKDSIYSGGLCPNGNTSTTKKPAPNYIKVYRRILERHLSKTTSPLEQQTDQARVLIPQSLTFLNQTGGGVFYSSLYDTLGFKVAVSPPSDEQTSNLGRLYAHSESCYPSILAHGHATFLQQHLRPGLDKLLLVNTISSGQERLKFCPHVASAGHVIKGNLNLNPEDVLLPVIYFNDPAHPVDKDVKKDLNRVFGKRKFSRSQVREAVQEAEQKQQLFLEETYKTGQKIVEHLKQKKEKIFVGVGRGYTLFDDQANSNVNNLFSQNGLHFVPSYFLRPRTDIDVGEIVDNMYWLQGRDMLRSTLDIATDPHLYYVRLTNFLCGPDSISLIHEEDIIARAEKPGLELETDGHNSNAQFRTRILANNEVVRNHNPDKKITLSSFRSYKPEVTDLEKRVIGVPYMGDTSDMLAATFRATGLNTEVMPTQTPDSVKIAKKHVTTNTCRPFAFQVGDHFAWLYSLQQKGLDPNQDAALFLPKASGPCRFGQYSIVLRKFLDQAGFSEVPIIDPSSEQDYLHAEIGGNRLKTVLPLLFRSCFANSLLESALLRTRPYEQTQGQTDQVYSQAHSDLVSLIETVPPVKKLKAFMQEQARTFEQIPKSDKRFPLVLVNGEIFVRCHEKSNEDSIRLLEENTLEVMLEPAITWIRYVNENSIRKLIDQRDFHQLRKSLSKKVYMDYVAKTLFKPFESYLSGREFHNPMSHIKAVERDLVFDSALEGESPVSVGEAYAFVNDHLNVDGIYHVGPHGCMQETVATSRIRAIIKEKRKKAQAPHQKIVPFLDAVFGESSLANLEANIALFADNCRVRRDLKEEVA